MSDTGKNECGDLSASSSNNNANQGNASSDGSSSSAPTVAAINNVSAPGMVLGVPPSPMAAQMPTQVHSLALIFPLAVMVDTVRQFFVGDHCLRSLAMMMTPPWKNGFPSLFHESNDLRLRPSLTVKIAFDLPMSAVCLSATTHGQPPAANDDQPSTTAAATTTATTTNDEPSTAEWKWRAECWKPAEPATVSDDCHECY